MDRREHTADSALVAFGDSITDGSNTRIDADHRWPDLLAERLRADRGLAGTGVLNAGIGGNRLLRDPHPPAGSPAESYAAYFGESGLKRFDRDVLRDPAAPGRLLPAYDSGDGLHPNDAGMAVMARAFPLRLLRH